MKLVLVTQHFPPHFEGGTETVVRAQARALADRGHQVRVVAGTDRPHAGADVLRGEVDGLPVAHLPRRPEEGYDLALARDRLLPLLLAETGGATLVHVHHWSTLHGALVRELARRAPVVVTLHDLFTTCPRFFRLPPDPAVSCPPAGVHEPCADCLAPDAPDVGRETLLAGLAARAAGFAAELQAAARLVAPSAWLAGRLAALTGIAEDRFRVLPHGLCRALAPAPARAPWTGTEPLVVLHFGHRSGAKGTLDLVHALAAVHAARPGAVRLELLGDEVQAGFDADLRAAAEGLPLEIESAYDDGALARAAAGAHLAAFPSRAQESYGLVVDEALALGLPTWVGDRGALAERVGSAGRVLPSADPEAWTAAVLELLDDPAALEAERARVPAPLPTARAAAAALEELYGELAEEAA